MAAFQNFSDHPGRPSKSGGRTVPTKGLFKEMPPSFLNLNGVVCSNTLFSNASALTSSLLFRGNSTCKILEHLVWSNTSGFQFWGPLARTNFLSVLCGLPTKGFQRYPRRPVLRKSLPTTVARVLRSTVLWSRSAQDESAV